MRLPIDILCPWHGLCTLLQLAINKPRQSKRRFNMADNVKLAGPDDMECISLVEGWEVRYWKEKLGVTGEQLVEAVKAVGIQAEDIRRHLASQSRHAD